MAHGIPLAVDVLPAVLHPAGSYPAGMWRARRYGRAAGVLAQGPDASLSWIRPGGLTSHALPVSMPLQSHIRRHAGIRGSGPEAPENCNPPATARIGAPRTPRHRS